MSFVFVNNVKTTLASGISSGATSLTLTSAANLPTLSAGQIFVLTLNDVATGLVFEIVHVTEITGAVCSGLSRGQGGTAAQSWLTLDRAYGAVTAGELAGFPQTVVGGLVELSPGTAQTGFIDVTGNVTAGDFIGSGSGLTGVPTGSLTVPPVLSLNTETGVVVLGSVDGSVTITPADPSSGHIDLKVTASLGSSIYNQDGTLLSSTPKFVQGSAFISAGTTSVNITLSGAAVFTSSSTYRIFTQPYQSSLPADAVSYFVTNDSGSEFTIICGAIGSNINLAWLAIGY